MVEWTPEQNIAINLRHKDILVSAAAGSGKTATLVERIIVLLTDEKEPLGPENILVTTFTNAAASEIKERVRKELKDRVAKDRTNLYLKKQLANINRASICTLHSFCTEVIRANFNLLDCDPGFSVTDETLSSKLLDNAIRETYSERLSDGNPVFKKLMNTLGHGKSFDTLGALILTVLKTVKSYPDYEEWLITNAKKTDLTGKNICTTDHGKAILDYLKDICSEASKEIDDLMSSIQDIMEGAHYYDTLQTDKNTVLEIQRLLSMNDWDACYEYVHSINFAAIPRKKKDFDDDVVNRIKNVRDNAKKAIRKVIEQFYDRSEQITEDSVYMLPIITEFVKVVIETDRKYGDAKKRRGLVDYNDMEHMALFCLKSGAGEDYKKKFKEIMIDEYQDFNYMQEAIIDSISNKNNVFAVGDIKQSIYRFRNAQPKLFLEKGEIFSKDNDKGEKLHLSKNFRSRSGILDFVNSLFAKIMSSALGEIDYNEDEKLNYGAEYKNITDNDVSYDTEILTVEYDNTIFPKEIGSTEAEAYAVANRIRELVNSGLLIYDRTTGDKRKLRYSDITVLQRAVKGPGQIFTKVFNKCGIECFSDQNIDFFKEKDILDIYAVLNVIDNPYQDIYVAQIMKNLIYGFNDKEIAIIKCSRDYLFNDVKKYRGPRELESKIRFFMDDMDDLFRYSKNNTADSIVFYAMTKTGIFYRSADQALLKKFYELSVEFVRKGMTSLFDFISYINSKKETDIDVISDKMNSADKDAVKIMSIHKSKGLEFPVVILSGCFRKFNMADSKDRLLIERELGIGCEYINDDKCIYHKSMSKNAIALRIKKQSISEEMRILYVALTRAKEKLIITGVTKTERSGSMNGGSCYFDWILPNVEPDSVRNISAVECAGIIGSMDSQDEIKEDMTRYNTGYYSHIMERLGYEYGYMEEVSLNRKWSATEIVKYKNKNYDYEEFLNTGSSELIKKPQFMDTGSKRSAAAKGTLMHRIMASVELKKLASRSYMDYLEANIPDKYHFDCIRSFVETPVFNDIIQADEVYQEKVFFLPVNTSDIPYMFADKLNGDHRILIQGVIDCLCIKGNEGVIIDYKTDKVAPGSETEHALKYAGQMDIYTKAAEQIMGIKIIKKVIHFFVTNTNVDINLL
jgi:ATP-dependent helicase/nuclease subunit A